MTSELETYINEQVLVGDVLEKLGYRRDPNKENYYYNHERGEKEASISVKVEENYCNDFGDSDFPNHPVKLVMHTHNLSMRDAINLLAKEFEITIPPTLAQSNGDEKTLRIRNTHKEYAKRCHETLLSRNTYANATLSELLESRNWKRETVEELELGLDRGVVPSMLKDGYSRGELEEASLLREHNNSSTMRNMVTCPMFDAKGTTVLNVVGFAHIPFENKQNHNPKGLPLYPYNLPVIKQAEKEGYILFCEGITDTITAVNLDLPAVGVPGATSFQNRWTKYFRNIPVVVTVFDCDEAGEKGLAKVVDALGNKCRIVRLPNPDNVKGYDLSDYLNAHSVNDFMELVKEAMKYTPTMLKMKESITKDASKLRLSAALKPCMVEMSKMPRSDLNPHLDFIKTYFDAADRDFITDIKSTVKSAAKSPEILIPPDDDSDLFEWKLSARRRDIPNLADITIDDTDDDIRKYLLIEEGGRIEVDTNAKVGNQIFEIPERFPEEVSFPRLSRVDRYLDTDDDVKLYNDIMTWHADAVEYPDPDDYHVMTCYTFLTHFHTRYNEVPGVLMTGDKDQGKTRAGQAIVLPGYRGKYVETVKDAHIIRFRDDWEMTLFFDCLNFWGKVLNEGSEDVFLIFWKRGATVPRCMYPEKGPYLDMVDYHVYGPLVAASNYAVNEIFESRCINISMQRRHRDAWKKISKTRALSLKERLTACYIRHFDDVLPIVDEKDYPAKGKFGEMTASLISIARLINPKGGYR